MHLNAFLKGAFCQFLSPLFLYSSSLLSVDRQGRWLQLLKYALLISPSFSSATAQPGWCGTHLAQLIGKPGYACVQKYIHSWSQIQHSQVADGVIYVHIYVCILFMYNGYNKLMVEEIRSGRASLGICMSVHA